VLGDANVPRGELTWRSEPGYAYYGAWRMPVLDYPLVLHYPLELLRLCDTTLVPAPALARALDRTT